MTVIHLFLNIYNIVLNKYKILFLFTVDTYLSPVETHCMNVDYFFLDTDNQTHEFSEDAMTRLRKFFILSIVTFSSKIFF